MSHATTSIYSTVLPSHRLFLWMILWNTLFYFFCTSLDLTHSRWLSCTELKLTFQQHKKEFQGKEMPMEMWCNSTNKASGAAEICIFWWRPGITVPYRQWGCCQFLSLKYCCLYLLPSFISPTQGLCNDYSALQLNLSDG